MRVKKNYLHTNSRNWIDFGMSFESEVLKLPERGNGKDY